MDFHYLVPAERYASGRPVYPAELASNLAGLCKHHETVWEAGCGSGQATRLLADHFQSVIATDASAEQIAAAAPIRNVRYQAANAETFLLPERSVDLVYVAQALHWFDRLRFIDTAFDSLKEGGVFAYSYYSQVAEDSPCATLLNREMNQIFEQFTPGAWNQTYVTPDFTVPGESLGQIDLFMPVTWNFLQLSTYLSSRSDFTKYHGETGNDAALPLLKQLSQIWPDPEQSIQFNWQLHLLAFRKTSPDLPAT